MEKEVIKACLENVIGEAQDALNKIDDMSKDELEAALIEVSNNLEEAKENL